MATPSAKRLPHDFFDDAQPFKLDGVYCKLIPLTKGQFAIVCMEDYARLAAHKWAALFNPNTRSYYAWRSSPMRNGKHHTILMHREILGLEKGDRRQGDHAFGRTLDNRRKSGDQDNLRVASASQNQWNKRRQRNNTTGYKNVTRDARYGKYMGQAQMGGKHVSFGAFDSAEAAFDAVCRGLPAMRGQFARTA